MARAILRYVDGPGSCVVWWADLSAQAPWHMQLLDEGERERRERLCREADRSRLTLAAALLRLAVAAEVGQVGLDAAAVRVERRCPTCVRPHGRPTLPDHPELHVSVSHSAQRVAVAVTRAGQVGVDVEEVSTVDTATLLAHVLAASERADASHPDPVSLTDFYTYWTRKEAVLKATGDGLRVAMTDVHVTAPGHPPRLLAYPNLVASEVQMCDLRPGEGYLGSLAVLCTTAVTVAERDASPLLSRP